MLVTIGLITFNRAECLVQSMKSLLNQMGGHAEIELLICDNASTDNTAERVGEFQVKYPKLRYQRNPVNLGFCGNVMKCLELTASEYLWFFADDDLIPDGAVERVLATLRARRPAILYLNHFAFDDGKPEVAVQKFLPEQDFNFDSGFEFFRFAGLGFLSSLIAKRDNLEEFRSKVHPALNNVHLEMAAYIALSKPGPFVFLGTVSVAARRPHTAAYNILLEGHANVLKIYRQLVEEGLLSQSFFEKWRHRDLVYGVFRSALYQFSSGNAAKVISSEPELQKLYGSDWAYKFTIGLLVRLPAWLVIGPYRFLRSAIRMVRIRLYRMRGGTSSK